MLYTIVPMDIVLQDEQKRNYNYVEKTINGQLIQLNKNSNNKYSVARIISTNPNAFLNPELQPGSCI